MLLADLSLKIPEKEWPGQKDGGTTVLGAKSCCLQDSRKMTLIFR